MPELPEVENVRRGLARLLYNHKITGVRASVSKLRKPICQEELNQWQKGLRITRVMRRGKYLILTLEQGRAVLIHLGMSGQLILTNSVYEEQDYERVRWLLSGNYVCRLIDKRRFSLVQNCTLDPETGEANPLAELGPEPLSSAFDYDYFRELCSRYSTSIKLVLLNQGAVAGIGNIYANEILFRAQIRPDRSVRTLDTAAQQRVVDETKAVLQEAINHGGTTFSDYRDVNGATGNFAPSLLVYGKNNIECPRCDVPRKIERIVQQGRSSYVCPECQF